MKLFRDFVFRCKSAWWAFRNPILVVTKEELMLLEMLSSELKELVDYFKQMKEVVPPTPLFSIGKVKPNDLQN